MVEPGCAEPQIEFDHVLTQLNVAGIGGTDLIAFAYDIELAINRPFPESCRLLRFGSRLKALTVNFLDHGVCSAAMRGISSLAGSAGDRGHLIADELPVSL
jgi:hypothetical protein